MTLILGISSFYHDSAAALIESGEIIAAAQEERFTRIKHDNSFPSNAIKYVLSEKAINLNKIDYIIYFEKPFLKFERLLETYIGFAPRGFKSFCAAMPVWLNEKIFQKKIIFNNLKKIDHTFSQIKKIKFSNHHLSHAASAYYPSPFLSAAILTLDGVGEWSTATISIGKKNKIEVIKEIKFPHSLGLLYSAFTYYLGFKVNSGEYKVMGLAPYGNPKYEKLIKKKLVDIKPDGSFRLDMNFFDFATGFKMVNQKFENLFERTRREPEVEKLENFHMDVAASIQKVLEEIVIKISYNISKEYKINNLCMAGGVALNCVANGKIQKKKIFKNLWIQPAAGDAGGALGAALAYWHNELDNDKINLEDSMKGSYLGPKYENDEIEKRLNSCGANFKSYNYNDLIEFTARQLGEEKAIGWFQGRMEFGPRALGARSIIANPKSDKMQSMLNLKVKFRESFRPFAPAILREDVEDYFDLDTDSPYMLLVSEINEKIKIKMTEDENKLFGIDKLNIKRSLLPSVTHVDYSARIQTVDGKSNKIFYDLIKKFKEYSGCPTVINTSFNIRGEPIVCTPEDAFKCFMGTELDILVCGNHVLIKDNQDKNLFKDYKNSFKLD